MSYRRVSKRLPPQCLQKRGIKHAIEVFPTEKTCEVHGAGRMLGIMFKRELYEILVLRRPLAPGKRRRVG